MSVEDSLSIASSLATLRSGHYCLPLPFRNENKLMPNNIKVAKEHLKGLKRCFLRDSAYAVEYTSFMQRR